MALEKRVAVRHEILLEDVQGEMYQTVASLVQLHLTPRYTGIPIYFGPHGNLDVCRIELDSASPAACVVVDAARAAAVYHTSGDDLRLQRDLGRALALTDHMNRPNDERIQDVGRALLEAEDGLLPPDQEISPVPLHQKLLHPGESDVELRLRELLGIFYRTGFGRLDWIKALHERLRQPLEPGEIEVLQRLINDRTHFDRAKIKYAVYVDKLLKKIKPNYEDMDEDERVLLAADQTITPYLGDYLATEET